MGTTMSGNQGRKRQRISTPEHSEALKEPSTSQKNTPTTITITEEMRDSSNEGTLVSLLNEREKLIKETPRLESNVKAFRYFMSGLTAMSVERQGGVCDDAKCIRTVTLYHAADNSFSGKGLNEGALSSLCGRIQAEKLTITMSEGLEINSRQVSKLKQLEELRIEYPHGKLVNIISLNNLDMLKRLCLRSNNIDNNDARHLFNIGTLEELAITDTMQLTNIRGISRLTNLKCLDLNSTNIDDSCIGEISACAKLSKLSVSECNNIIDATPISQLAALEELNLNSNCHITKGIGTLGMLLRLRMLDLSGVSVEDNFLKDLCDCGPLERLNLSYCIQLTNINPLSNATAIEELNLNGCRRITRGIGVVWALPKLRVLHMKGVHLSEPSLDSVGTGGSLVKVSLDNCAGFGDMTLLSSIVTLEELNIQKCADIISGVCCLGTLPYLRVLNIKEAHISSLDFTGIGASKSLLQLTLESITGLSNVEALANILTLEKLSLLGCNGIDAGIGCLGNLPQLKVLDLSGTNTDSDSLRGLCVSQTIVSLNLSHCWKVTSVFHISALETLNELNLSDCIRINAGWEALEKLQQLHVAILSNTHITDRDISHFSKCKELVTLDLSFCDELFDITSLSNITTLEDLNLDNCSKIRKGLSVLGELPRLRVLNVKGVHLTNSVIGSLGNGKSFVKLILDNCKGLSDVTFLSSLSTLKELNLHHCDAVTSGIGTLGRLLQLRVLDLGWTKIDNNSLEDICACSSPLVSLNLSHCKEITSISAIASLNALEKLNIDNCCHVTSGWNVFGTLHQLRVAVLSNTRINDENIRHISECKSLNTLNLAFCNDITDITALSNITMLRELNIDWCFNIEKGVEALGKLPKLRELDAKKCGTSVRWMQQYPYNTLFKSLVKLNLENGRESFCVGTLSSTAIVEELLLGRACEPYHLPPISSLRRLRVLNLDDGRVCDIWLEGISQSKSLQSLNVSNCNYITDISALSSLSTLEELNVNCCDRIRKGWEAFEALTRLRVATLSVTWVTNEGIRLLSGCKNLRNLELYCCRDVSNIEPINNIKSLEELTIQNCHNINEGLLKVGMLPRLRVLVLRKLQSTYFSLSSLGESKSLVKLTIEGPEELCDIKLISNIATLKELKIAHGDRLLNDVGDLGKLPWLHVLTLSHFNMGNTCFESVCKIRSLKSLDITHSFELPDIYHISNLTALEELNLSGCYHIISGWEALTALPRLRVLNLSSTRVTTSYGGYYISRCKSLITLNLESCDMTDASCLADIKTLEELHIGKCEELTRGFSALFTLPQLRILNLMDSLITDEDLREIQLSHTIEDLNLSYCKELNDITPVRRIKSIKKMDLHRSSEGRGLREGFRSLLELPCLSWVDIKNANVSFDVYKELKERKVDIYN
ncbi:T. brucei spp.-specific protein [Trypanosoma brucei gambiense DAL972]|uniref:T. brucei spp.-specific protein n=1 Tax=Trypanosoma brucei gambiense (strain MHOM/CI/86/DAL972) TaxID=679716 RepID=D0A5U4_TRYB9|nr:LOW QUALITY PROTEIN: T. brucei spp.-specific protein [Trypanosoma brucei gambiense DAL972]CBH17045.1 T. brucei spp.-specific protein [Trypanosoma brucei gambiense DAL972]|eukprot:XP_011779309.1 LOW QUALITY PROTEIN: T. brucei spp.-specific protein [Trypanosoma brucei gambiense DAL972]